MRVPPLDLKAQYAALETEITEALIEACRKSAFALGPAVEQFERDWATYCEAQRCVAVNSGTDALHLALLAVGVGPGDEVITTPMTFFATCEAIIYCGATPVFVDIDPETYCLRPDLVEAAVTQKTRAILPVHIFGQSADMDPLLATAKQHGLAVVEDAAQAHGAVYKGRKVGAIGDVGCFSFYVTKNMGAFGEGGAVTCNSDEYADKAKLLRVHGQSGPYLHTEIGYNYRMHGFQGAILNVKLKYLDGWNVRRRDIAERYWEGLGDSPLRLPVDADYGQHAYHVYVTRCDRRDALMEHLRAADIVPLTHYPIPMHKQPALEGRTVHGALPEAEQHAAEAVSLPLFPEMSDAQIDYVIETALAFFA
jgi:dTDP-4-amino-4,6-dideoxygalactose transaminase